MKKFRLHHGCIYGWILSQFFIAPLRFVSSSFDFPKTLSKGYPLRSPAFLQPWFTYLDWTASSQPLDFIEQFISQKILPFYANTHTFRVEKYHKSYMSSLIIVSSSGSNLMDARVDLLHSLSGDSPGENKKI